MPRQGPEAAPHLTVGHRALTAQPREVRVGAVEGLGRKRIEVVGQARHVGVGVLGHSHTVADASTLEKVRKGVFVYL